MRAPRIPAKPRPKHVAYRCTACVVCVIALALTGFVQATDQPVDQRPDAAPRPTEALDFGTLPVGKVTRILDENTVLIEIDDRTVRYDLLGVSAASTERDASHTHRATDALTRMVLGETVAIEHDPQGERNIANRRAAYLYRNPDHLFVNLELVRQGYTRHSPISMTIHTKVFDHYQTRAQNLFRGIWDPQAPIQPIPESTDNENPDQGDPANNQQPANTTAAVYITTYGTRYHAKDCPHLTDSARPTSRDQIKDTHKPCKTCKPDDG